MVVQANLIVITMMKAVVVAACYDWQVFDSNILLVSLFAISLSPMFRFDLGYIEVIRVSGMLALVMGECFTGLVWRYSYLFGVLMSILKQRRRQQLQLMQELIKIRQ